MKITIERFFSGEECLIGRVYINDEFFCYSLENLWLDNKPRVSAIPEGTYKCQPYSSQKYPNTVELQNVVGRSKILIHAGNKAKDTMGCILLGENYSESQEAVWNSRRTLESFFGKAGYEFDIVICSSNVHIDSSNTTGSDQKQHKKQIKMALPLLALVAPFAKIIGRKLTKKAAEKILKKVKEKTGINITTKEEAQEAIEQLSPNDLKEIKMAAIESDTKMFLAEIKRGEDLEKTWKDEFITVIPWITLLYILGILTFNPTTGKEIIEALTVLLSGNFGIILVIISLSAAGLKSVAMKIAEGFKR